MHPAVCPADSAGSQGVKDMKAQGKKSDRFRRFKEFAANTTLHGWVYLSNHPLNSWQGLFWLAVIIPVYAVAGMLVVTNTDQYINAGIQTASATKASSLGAVYFPSITVCNINQVENSFMEELGISENYTQMSAVYNEFISGASPLTHQQDILDSIEWFQDKDLVHQESFSSYASQPCRNLILYIRYQDEEAYWGDLDYKISAITDATDYGFCCFITPQAALKPVNTSGNVTVSREQFHTGVPVGSKNGEENGVALILDIENFNFAYHRSPSQGLKVAVHDHRSKPFMEHESMLVSAGRHTLISAKPVLTFTTDMAVDDLSPKKRDCYVDGEAHLRYFEWEMGYFYNLNNCLFNFALHRILRECNCKPFFMPKTSEQAQQNHHRQAGRAAVDSRPFCTGSAIRCMYDIVGDIEGEDGVAFVIPRLDGGNKTMELEEVNWQEEKRRLNQSGMECLPRCTQQTNYVQQSSARYPQQRKFVFQKSFCYLAKKLYEGACADEKRGLVNKYHKNLCDLLDDRGSLVANCSQWPYNYVVDTDRVEAGLEAGQSFLAAMQGYADENLAEINLIINSPSVQMIKRDKSITFVTFIGGTGGLLGLCLGFSFISLIEFVYHIVLSRMEDYCGGGGGRAKKRGGSVEASQL